MWAAAAPLPYYSAYRPTRRKGSTNEAGKEGSSLSHASKTQPSGAVASKTADAPATSPPPSTPSNIAIELLGPAVEGPPSPRRLRALSNKVKQASTAEKHRSHHPSLSASSALYHSPNAERPAWDQVLDNITLSRRSSGRSTSSSMPSRERPDSVQILGKAIFGRKGRLKRESSAHSSSGSSLYSGELVMDGPSQNNKDHFIPALFGRRKAAKSDPYRDLSMSAAATPTPGKPLISGPYNFQHVTHTRRDHLPNLQRASRMELVAEFSTLKSAPQPADIPYDYSYMGGNNAEAEPHTRIFMDRPTLRTRHTAPQTGPRRLVKASKSQENLRAIPPRPPRPPRSPIIESVESQYHAPPIPPPRLSSRQSIRYGGYDPLETTTLERPMTSYGAFRQPEPFRFAHESHEPPMTSHGYIPSPVMYEETSPQSDYLHAMTTPDDEAWPLTPPAPLPPTPKMLAGVPEEEESRVSRKERSSVLSTSSSIRRSQSVPQLRHLSQDEQPKTSQRRPPSSGSDTLGRFDLFAAQRALRAAAREEDEAEAPCRSSWEDDIDYCYEHEVEADCHYEWTRPSLDNSCRDEHDETTAIRLDTARSEQSYASGSTPDATSGFYLAPDQYDLPALSPGSRTSINDPEALTPTAPTVLVTSNFSLPRNEIGLPIQRPRADSRASSFKESHGFTLSPSLLIPTDYRQQMMMCEADMAGYDNESAFYVGGYPAFNDKVTAGHHHSSSTVDRVSTSTIGTESTGRSGSSTSEPHQSIASASTSFTRFTSENSDTWSSKSPKSPRLEMAKYGNDCSFVEQMIPGQSLPLQSPPLQSTVDFETAVLAREPKLKSRLDIGRPRAKTTSLTTPPPQLGRFSLFPRPDPMNRI